MMTENGRTNSEIWQFMAENHHGINNGEYGQ